MLIVAAASVVPVTVMELVVEVDVSPIGLVMSNLGAVASYVMVTALEARLWLPTPSVAVAVMVFSPLDRLIVPLNNPLLSDRVDNCSLSLTSTLTVAPLSADPLMVSVRFLVMSGRPSSRGAVGGILSEVPNGVWVVIASEPAPNRAMSGTPIKYPPTNKTTIMTVAKAMRR